MSKMIWFLCSKLPSAVLLRRRRKMREGDFGAETCTNCAPGSVRGPWAEKRVLAKCYNLPRPGVVRPSQHPSPHHASALPRIMPAPFPAACQRPSPQHSHGLPLKRPRDHSQRAVFTPPGSCWRWEGFAGEDASFLCRLPLVPAAFQGSLLIY